MTRPSYGKLDRERSKKAKAEAKRERRRAGAETKEAGVDRDDSDAPADASPTADVLRMLDELHRQHGDGEITDEDFQLAKADLLARLVVD
jgi:hypothetical protein